jgi:aryl-alcohol dehydrogenase-like predicted oxidoreductase
MVAASPEAATQPAAAVPLAGSGSRIPVLGLGVFKAEGGGSCKAAVLSALQAGYRLIDTAAIYQNEADVGAAVRECGLPREEVFVTSKVCCVCVCVNGRSVLCGARGAEWRQCCDACMQRSRGRIRAWRRQLVLQLSLHAR